MNTHYRTPCGWKGRKLYPRTTNAAQLYRPRGKACDGCQRDGVVWYEDGIVAGELCRVEPFGVDETRESTTRAQRKVETAQGDERDQVQATLF